MVTHRIYFTIYHAPCTAAPDGDYVFPIAINRVSLFRFIIRQQLEGLFNQRIIFIAVYAPGDYKTYALKLNFSIISTK